jgi:hypothetical protein
VTHVSEARDAWQRGVPVTDAFSKLRNGFRTEVLALRTG